MIVSFFGSLLLLYSIFGCLLMRNYSELFRSLERSTRHGESLPR
jgi:hypothetical protein